MNNIYKLLKQKDHKYSEKRLLVSSYNYLKIEEEKIYLTGVLLSKDLEKESKSQSKIQSKIHKMIFIYI